MNLILVSGLMFAGYVLALVAILLIVLWPGRFPYTVSTYGKLLPAQEWVLLRDNNGMIASVLRDNRSGAVRSYTLSQLERGAAMSLGFARLQPDALIAAGDTVAWAVSTDMEYAMATLRGNLAVAEAALDAARAGVDVAVQAGLVTAVTQVDLQGFQAPAPQRR